MRQLSLALRPLSVLPRDFCPVLADVVLAALLVFRVHVLDTQPAEPYSIGHERQDGECPGQRVESLDCTAFPATPQLERVSALGDRASKVGPSA